MSAVIDLTDETDPIPPETDSCQSPRSEEYILIEDSDDSLDDLPISQDDSPIVLSDHESHDSPGFHRNAGFKDQYIQSWQMNETRDTIHDLSPLRDDMSNASTISDTSSEPETFIQEIDLNECQHDLFRSFNEFKREIRYHQQSSRFREREYVTSNQKWQDRDLIFKLLMSTPAGQDMYTICTIQDMKMGQFVRDPCQPDFYVLDEMPHALRIVIRDRVDYYRLRSEMRGLKKSDRYTAIVRTNETECPPRRKGTSASFAQDAMLKLWWSEWKSVKKSKLMKVRLLISLPNVW